MTSRRLARAINERWERGLQTDEAPPDVDEYHGRMVAARAELAALREPTETRTEMLGGIFPPLDRIEVAQ